MRKILLALCCFGFMTACGQAPEELVVGLSEEGGDELAANENVKCDRAFVSCVAGCDELRNDDDWLDCVTCCGTEWERCKMQGDKTGTSQNGLCSG